MLYQVYKSIHHTVYICTLNTGITSSNHSKQPHLYSLSNQYKKELLIHGYVNEIPLQSIPDDITDIIHSFYSYVIIWKIEGDTMTQFKKCKHKEVMHGPQIEIGGIKLELTLCPQGWTKEGFLACFIEKIKSKCIPHNFITIAVLFYVKEVDIFAKMGKKLQGSLDGTGLDWKAIPFDQVKELKSLEIECDLDVLHIDYDKYTEPSIYTNVAKLEGIICYKWEITDKLLCSFKQINRRGYYYTDNFYNDSLALACTVWNDGDGNGGVKLQLKLLKVPYGLDGYFATIHFRAHVNENTNVTEKIVENGHLIQSKTNNCEAIMFTWEELQTINVLSFLVQIDIIKIKPSF